MFFLFVSEVDYTLDESIWNEENPVGKYWIIPFKVNSKCQLFLIKHNKLFSVNIKWVFLINNVSKLEWKFEKKKWLSLERVK